ncbi:hypothetical protein BHO_0900074 (plasmid) [Borrelia hermsii YBT]|uniref:Variable outer membrane protein n=1 Tax=Borrelia hermsii YBT TaxID=1313295 RepID=W5T3D7_BORHE|nr:hypothetical protein [Borrelia hermsii]AHH13284.1 hypothetical protein BHO_0900065 [Borrelia hermsii YBT]AHH13388.1 hypothetical protein BHO_0900074 [Borrelia hermsii YBT]
MCASNNCENKKIKFENNDFVLFVSYGSAGPAEQGQVTKSDGIVID